MSTPVCATNLDPKRLETTFLKAAYPKIWLLYPVLSRTLGRVTTALCIFAGLVLIFWLAGAFQMPTPSGVVLFFVVMISYIIPVLGLILDRANHCLDELADLLPVPAEEIYLERRSLSWQLGVLLMGTSVGLTHVGLLFLAGNLGTVPGTPDFIVLAGTLMVWIVMTTSIYALFETATIFKQLAVQIEIDLLMTHRLKPFGQIALAMTLSMIGAQAALPIMFIDGISLVAFIPGFIALLIPLVLLVLIPTLPVRRRIIQQKQVSLQQINAEILATRQGELKEQAEQLQSLLNYRREIEQVSEWPLDLGVAIRLVLYLLIPPLTWVGAALIENLVDTLL